MAVCRACHAMISFVPTPRGKLAPVNSDGTSHFGTCPQAARFKKPATPDNLCHVCGGDSIEREPGVGPHYGKLRCQDCNGWRWQRRPVEASF